MLDALTATGISVGTILTASAVVELTSTLPLLSRISPRGGAIGTSRVRLTAAARTYWLPVSTCRNHSRKNTTANRASTTDPTIATRSASAGVSGERRSSGPSVIATPGRSAHRAAPRAETAG